LVPGPIYETGGKAKLDLRLPAYASAARFAPWVVQRDLDNDASCAPALSTALAAKFRGTWPSGLNLIVAVREVESWILADRGAFARFLGVGEPRLPAQPEQVPDAKLLVVRLAGGSRKKKVRESLVPRPGSGRHVGPGYNSVLQEFVEEMWDPDRAVQGGAHSLAKLLERVDRFCRIGSWV
jgi:hypothetical protein